MVLLKMSSKCVSINPQIWNMDFWFCCYYVIIHCFVFFKSCANKDYIKVPTINDRCKMQQ